MTRAWVVARIMTSENGLVNGAGTDGGTRVSETLLTVPRKQGHRYLIMGSLGGAYRQSGSR
jgi:hypothetical protein